MNFKKILPIITAFTLLFISCSKVFADEIETIEAKELQKKIVKEEPIDESFVIDFSKYKEKMTLKGATQETAPQKKSEVDLVSDEMIYHDEENELEAKGNAKMTIKPEGTTLSAQRMVYNQNTNIIKAYTNVVIVKDGAKLKGDFMQVDLNEENVLMNEPIGEFYKMKITAQEGYAYSNRIEAVNGDAELAKKIEMALATSNFGGYDAGIIKQQAVDFELKKMRVEPYRIKTKEIIIDSQREHDTITFKNADIYYKNFKLGSAGNIKVVTNKAQDFIETNLPEIGSLGDFGFYMGPGYVQNMPKGSTLKIAPIAVFGDGVGVGAIGKFRSKNNYTEAAYGTSKNEWILRGHQKFGDNLQLDYSHGGYIDEWFQGERRPGYLLQMVYQRAFPVPDFGKGTVFTHRLTGGYVSEYRKPGSNLDEYGTARIRYQNELNKPFFSIGDREQDMYLSINGIAQTSATVYGTGQTVGIVRGGPSIESRVKGWGSRISYYLAGIHGLSPFSFDQYRYGKSSLNIDENIRLHRYLTIGYLGNISPLRDNPENELLTENRFYAVLGPDDLKIALGYDSVRKRTLFDVIFLLGTDNTKIKFDKFRMQNPTGLSQPDERAMDKEYAKVEETL